MDTKPVADQKHHCPEIYLTKWQFPPHTSLTPSPIPPHTSLTPSPVPPHTSLTPSHSTSHITHTLSIPPHTSLTPSPHSTSQITHTLPHSTSHITHTLPIPPHTSLTPSPIPPHTLSHSTYLPKLVYTVPKYIWRGDEWGPVVQYHCRTHSQRTNEPVPHHPTSLEKMIHHMTVT